MTPFMPDMIGKLIRMTIRDKTPDAALFGGAVGRLAYYGKQGDILAWAFENVPDGGHIDATRYDLTVEVL